MPKHYVSGAWTYDCDSLFHIKESMENLFENCASYAQTFPTPFVCPSSSPEYLLLYKSCSVNPKKHVRKRGSRASIQVKMRWDFSMGVPCLSYGKPSQCLRPVPLQNAVAGMQLCLSPCFASSSGFACTQLGTLWSECLVFVRITGQTDGRTSHLEITWPCEVFAVSPAAISWCDTCDVIIRADSSTKCSFYLQ